ncbi:MAG: PIG-L family deacetylase [Chloroflexi bacterium]|nr:PIG-L family deacetylase [Chloroflexota bacterium]
MFIYAHPDDIEFGVAGTAAVWAKHGCEVTYVVITDGNVGSHEAGVSAAQLAEIRRAEQTAAAEVVGASCIFLGYDDGLLEPTLALRKQLVRLLRQYRPNAVVCGDPTLYFPGDNYINHPDHRAAAQVALDAVFPAAEMHLLYPDLAEEGLEPHKINYVYISRPVSGPNYYVDISETMALKIEALRRHVSQLGEWVSGRTVAGMERRHGQASGLSIRRSFPPDYAQRN